MIRALVKNVLGSHGYTVFEADDGEHAEALFRAQEASIDLVITDVVLPGFERSRSCGAAGHDASRNTGALHVRLYARRDRQPRHPSPGLAFLQKPFTPDPLLLKVREILDAARPMPELAPATMRVGPTGRSAGRCVSCARAPPCVAHAIAPEDPDGRGVSQRTTICHSHATASRVIPSP